MPDERTDENRHSHDLAAGIVLVRDDAVLAVYENDYWTLPKGGCECGEFFARTAVREAKEETGLDVDIAGLAFTSEVRISDGVQHFQRYYEATADGEPEPNDPEGEVRDAAFIPVDEVPRLLRYRPITVPLLEWLDVREPVFRRFDLRTESAELETR